MDFTCLFKYLLEGLAIAVVAYVIPRRGLGWGEVLIMALTASFTLALLDYVTPAIAQGTRLGSGFGIGLIQVV
jgi:hypothetical protein